MKKSILFFPVLFFVISCGATIPILNERVWVHEVTARPPDCASVDIRLEDGSIWGLEACKGEPLEVCQGERPNRYCIPTETDTYPEYMEKVEAEASEEDGP